MTAQPPGLLGRIIAALGAFALLVLGFFFSLVLLAVILVLGLAGWGYFWWKTRHARRAMREQARDSSIIEGEAVVIEGETVVEENRVLSGEVLPRR